MSYSDATNCNLHPSFQSKSVYELRCNICEGLVCARGMRAILLADRNVQLYSTDLPPPGCVQLIGENYETNNCSCRIKDVACSNCGNTVGYHVTLPCHSCLASCNNGHFWMYHSSNIHSQERLNLSETEILVWAEIPSCSQDKLMLPAHKLPISWLEWVR